MKDVFGHDCSSFGPDPDAQAMEASGLPDTAEERFHTDVMGKWGGKRAVVGHFVDDKGYDRMFLYILVGSYGMVGTWAGEETGAPSKWSVAKLLTKALQEGVDTAKLYAAIQYAVSPSYNPLEAAADRLLVNAPAHAGTETGTEPLLAPLGNLASACAAGDTREMQLCLTELGALVLNWLVKLTEVEADDAGTD